MPARIRGIGLGLAVLAAAPVVAAAIATSTAFHLTAAHNVDRVQPVGQDVPLRASLQIRLHQATPSPAPVPKPPVLAPVRSTHAAIPGNLWPHNAVVDAIVAAAQRWGDDPNFLLRIASCESGLRPNAYNPRGPYYGLFQFLMSTFLHNGGTDIWSPVDQANIAAKMIAHGQAHQWSCA